MGRLALPPLLRLKPDLDRHVARQEGPRIGGGGPDALVEPGEDDEVERQQPRFEQAEQGDAGGLGRRGPDRQPGVKAGEGVGQMRAGKARPEHPASAAVSVAQRTEHVASLGQDCRRRAGIGQRGKGLSQGAAAKFGGVEAFRLPEVR